MELGMAGREMEMVRSLNWIVLHSKKGLVDPTNGLLINTLYDVFKQHIPLVGIVRITM